MLSVLSPIHTILRNISSPRLPLSFSPLSLSFSSPSRGRTRKRFIVVANGPSSWRHGRGDGIKSRRAARDLLIVATESSRRYPPWRRTPPSARDSLRALLHSSYDPLRRTLRAYTDELIFFFYRPRRLLTNGPARPGSASTAALPLRITTTSQYYAYSRPSSPRCCSPRTPPPFSCRVPQHVP